MVMIRLNKTFKTAGLIRGGADLQLANVSKNQSAHGLLHGGTKYSPFDILYRKSNSLCRPRNSSYGVAYKR